eukprot:g18964.t1
MLCSGKTLCGFSIFLILFVFKKLAVKRVQYEGETPLFPAKKSPPFLQLWVTGYWVLAIFADFAHVAVPKCQRRAGSLRPGGWLKMHLALRRTPALLSCGTVCRRFSLLEKQKKVLGALPSDAEHAKIKQQLQDAKAKKEEARRAARRQRAKRERKLRPPAQIDNASLLEEVKHDSQVFTGLEKEQLFNLEQLQVSTQHTDEVLLLQDDVQWRWQEEDNQKQQHEAQCLLRVAVVGPPNAGKSQLVNALVGSKVSAVTPKRNTTRKEVLGVSTFDNIQMVFFDTPGINPPEVCRHEQRELAVTAWNALQDVHLALVVIDASGEVGEAELNVLKQMREQQEQLPELVVHLVLNKVDLVNPKRLLIPLTERLWSMCKFEECWMISALTHDGVDDVENHLLDMAPPGQWIYKQGVTTDLTPVQRVEEVVREKIYQRLNQEIPYAIQQKTLGWEDRPDGSVRIDMQLTVNSEGQKKKLIGLKGEVLKQIRDKAAKDAESILGRSVQLLLHVHLSKV